jgi:hypothetical protein
MQELMNNHSSLPNNNYPQVPSNFTVDYGAPLPTPSDLSSFNLGRGVSPNLTESVNMSLANPHPSHPNESIIINSRANFSKNNMSQSRSIGDPVNAQTHYDIVNNDNWGLEDPQANSKVREDDTQMGSGMILEDDKRARYETVVKPDGSVVVVNRDEKYGIIDGTKGKSKRGDNMISICPDTGITVVRDGGGGNVVNMEVYGPGMSMVPEEPELRDSFFDNERGSMVV